MANMKEISELAKVSQGTASLVLNGKGDQYRISQATQQRIIEAAKLMNYKPNISARRLRSQGETVSPIIAVFWTMDTRSQLIGRYLNGVQQALQKCNDEYEILIQPYVGSRLCDVRSLITGTRFNAAIIANPTEEDEAFLNGVKPNVPVVLYQRDSAQYCTVHVDGYNDGATIANLFADRGHTKVGIVIPDVSSRAISNRMNGFIEQCGNRQLTAVTYVQEFSELGGYLSAIQVGQEQNRPTAIFFLCDQMAIGGLFAFNEIGVTVPDQLEVVGYDDDQVSRFSSPPLTTIHLPVEEMAAECVTLAINMMSQQTSEPMSKPFTTSLIVRKSCGGFPSI